MEAQPDTSRPQSDGVVLVPGPLESAWAWLACVVVDGDLSAAWPHTDRNLRLALVQSWVWATRTRPPACGWNREELARGLLPERSQHPVWPAFARWQVEKLRLWWGDPDLDAWGAAFKGRVVASEYELIRFTPLETKRGHMPRPSPAKGGGRLLLVRATPDGWLVAGFDRRPPTPGWPPTG